MGVDWHCASLGSVRVRLRPGHSWVCVRIWGGIWCSGPRGSRSGPAHCQGISVVPESVRGARLLMERRLQPRATHRGSVRQGRHVIGSEIWRLCGGRAFVPQHHVAFAAERVGQCDPRSLRGSGPRPSEKSDRLPHERGQTQRRLVGCRAKARRAQRVRD